MAMENLHQMGTTDELKIAYGVEGFWPFVEPFRGSRKVLPIIYAAINRHVGQTNHRGLRGARASDFARDNGKAERGCLTPLIYRHIRFFWFPRSFSNLPVGPDGRQ